MTIKRKFITGWVVIAALSAAMILIGIWKRETMFFDYGIAMLFVGIVRVIRDLLIMRDKKRIKELEVLQKDERNIYLTQKSHAWTFWISVIGEYAAFLVCSFMNMITYAKIFAYIVCIQLIIYVILRYVFNKKY